MSQPRVLLADDHRLVLEGFRKLLEPHFELVGAVEDGRTLLEVAARLEPDVVLLDISMPLLNGIDAAKRLRKLAPRSKIIFLTMHADPAYVSEALRVGASGYLLKRSAATELVFAIGEVLKGGVYVTPQVTRGVLDHVLSPSGRHRPPPSHALTRRQREVLQLVAEGKSIKEIASILDISVKTVEFHKSRIMKGLGVHTTAGLTQYAIAHRLIAFPQS